METKIIPSSKARLIQYEGQERDSAADPAVKQPLLRCNLYGVRTIERDALVSVPQIRDKARAAKRDDPFELGFANLNISLTIRSKKSNLPMKPFGSL
jgi:hypothetical protein